jgi:hypothetical protein
MSFSATSGGVVCPSCATDHATVRLSAGSLKVLQLLSDPTSPQWRRLQVQAGMDREIGAATRSTIERVVGRNLRTAQFLGESPS